jgi:hypothetical protein
MQYMAITSLEMSQIGNYYFYEKTILTLKIILLSIQTFGIKFQGTMGSSTMSNRFDLRHAGMYKSL